MLDQRLESLFSKNKFGDSDDLFFKGSRQVHTRLRLTGRARRSDSKLRPVQRNASVLRCFNCCDRGLTRISQV